MGEQTEQEQQKNVSGCNSMEKLHLLGLLSHRLVAQGEEKALGRHRDEKCQK